MTGRILVADEVPTNRIVLKAKLSAACHEVLQATSGREVIARARNDQPDLIILDVDLGDLDGVTVCKRLKADTRTGDIPVILMTRKGDANVRLAGLAAGADEFLAKPVQEATLLARVRNLIRASDTLRELRERNQTCRDLGFAEAPPQNVRPDWVVLVTEEPKRAGALAQAISRGSRRKVSVLSRKQVLGLHQPSSPDVFVLLAAPFQSSQHMQSLAELRAKSTARHAGVIVIAPQAAMAEAAMALDLGANDVVADTVSSEELDLRLELQLRGKRKADQLRATLADGLHQAVLDPLTGLYNRRYALHHLERMSQNARRTNRSFGVMMLDIDHFKRVNDRFGHPTGDLILQEVARRLQETIRAVDLVARFGGEEFLVVIPDAEPEVTRNMAERLRCAIGDMPFELPRRQNPLGVTLSLGGAMARPGWQNTKTLIANADKALYASKARGRNTVTFAPLATTVGRPSPLCDRAWGGAA